MEVMKVLTILLLLIIQQHPMAAQCYSLLMVGRMVYRKTLVLQMTAFTGNTSSAGGAIAALSGSPLAIEVQNSTFTDNSSSTDGGAINVPYQHNTWRVTINSWQPGN